MFASGAFIKELAIISWHLQTSRVAAFWTRKGALKNFHMNPQTAIIRHYREAHSQIFFSFTIRPRLALSCSWTFSSRKPFQPLTRPAVDRPGFYRELCSPSYCSAPQTWQTDAHRLMRDRHRRHILKRARHHRNDDASTAKTKRMTFWSIASRLFHARSQVLMG